MLETGIALHSVLIGIALGVSNSPCTIRPLLAALTFHQFFEGVALGSCLLQVGYPEPILPSPSDDISNIPGYSGCEALAFNDPPSEEEHLKIRE